MQLGSPLVSLHSIILKKVEDLALAILSAGPIPKHVGFIPDGNRRYARSRQISIAEGHMEGFKLARRVEEITHRLGIERLTIYGFSIANFSRSQDQLDALFLLYAKGLNCVFDPDDIMNKHRIRLDVVGKVEMFPDSLRELIEKTQKVHNPLDNLGIINLTLAYTSRDEITSIIQSCVRDAVQGGISSSTMCQELAISKQAGPPLDILVRTKGRRLSDFMLWQSCENTQLQLLHDKHWPEFSFFDFASISLDYQRKVYAKEKPVSRPGFKNNILFWLLRFVHVIYGCILFISAFLTYYNQIERSKAGRYERIPRHLALNLVAPKDSKPQDQLLQSSLTAVRLCRAAGIAKLTIYEEHGRVLGLAQDILDHFCPENQNEWAKSVISETGPPHGDTVTIRIRGYPIVEAHSQDLILCLASRASSKPAIAAVACSLASTYQSSARDEPFTITEDELNDILEAENGLSSPDLMIVHRLYPSLYDKAPVELYGYPPWHIRMTEIFCDRFHGSTWSGVSEPCAVDEGTFYQALAMYAKLEPPSGAQ